MPSEMPATAVRGGLPQRAWQAFCRAVARVFYRRCEVDGLEHLPASGPVLLCANHADALADALIVQAVIPRAVHPLARSGLFANPILRPLLDAQQAVPIYRRQDAAGDAAAPDSHTARNSETFARCWELLAEGEVLLIFPEGQSHSDPRLRPIKTGAARLALGAEASNGVAPTILPVGLTFTRKGRFRSSVLVQVGAPVAFPPPPADDSEAVEEVRVRELTTSLQRGLETVTLNVDSWDEFELLRSLQRFFAFRRGRRRYRKSLRERFRALQHLIETHRRLVADAPEEVTALSAELRRFERLCDRFGVDDYQLTIRYRPWVVAKFLARTLVFGLLIFPLFLWAVVNAAVPYLLTRALTRRLARGSDQHDTAKIVIGSVLVSGFWTAQTFLVWRSFGWWPAVAYGVSLPVTAIVALAVARERTRLIENTRMFLVFTRQVRLRAMLLERRRALEVRLARFARRAKAAWHERQRAGAPPPAPFPDDEPPSPLALC
jgi:1-acyl-sn-glycerol-3-phosphate acyltransferase